MLELRRAALCCFAWAVFGAMPGRAIGQEGISPYAGETDRKIKALAPSEIVGLLDGDGLGFAKAAELNGVPGPRHVLDLDSELGLDDRQRADVRAVYERMHAEAVELGVLVIDLERQLDRAFADGKPTAADVQRLSAEIGEVRGRLRATHLIAHVETANLLTSHQISRYAQLRGYSANPEHDVEGHLHEGAPHDGF